MAWKSVSRNSRDADASDAGLKGNSVANRRVTNGKLERDLYELKGEVEARLEALEAGQQANSKTLDDIHTTMSEIRGGRKALAWLVGAAAAFGSLVSWVTTHVDIN